MNLIDRDMLIEELKHFHWTAYQPLSAHPCEYDDAVRIVLKQQTISNSPCYPDSAFRWIPVSEIDPEEELKIGNSKVLIATNYDYYVATFEDGEWISSERITVERDGEYVIAWKPIEPYTGHKEQI